LRLELAVTAWAAALDADTVADAVPDDVEVSDMVE
jgi:hypothetical protein